MFDNDYGHDDSPAPRHTSARPSALKALAALSRRAARAELREKARRRVDARTPDFVMHRAPAYAEEELRLLDERVSR